MEYDEEGEEDEGEFAGDDGRDSLDPELRLIRKTVRSNVRLICLTLEGKINKKRRLFRFFHAVG